MLQTTCHHRDILSVQLSYGAIANSGALAAFVGRAIAKNLMKYLVLIGMNFGQVTIIVTKCIKLIHRLV